MKKRILSILLACSLCLTLLPVSAWAEEAPDSGGSVVQEQEEPQQEELQPEEPDPDPAPEPEADPAEQAAENGIAVQADTVDNAVAEVTIDGKTMQYADIAAAFNAAKDENVHTAAFKLLQDATIQGEYGDGVMVKNSCVATLDLNGHTLRQTGNATYTGSGATINVYDTAELTILDSSSEKTGKIEQINGCPAIRTNQTAKLTIESGTIETTTLAEMDSSSKSSLNCAVNLDDKSTVIINGGTLKGVRGVVEDLSDGGGSLTINGGTFIGSTGNALIVYRGAATLSGGTFSSSDNTHSIWVDNGTAASLLADGYKYMPLKYSEDGKGVVGNTTVKNFSDNAVSYLDADNKLNEQKDCTEITDGTSELTGEKWYVVAANTTLQSLTVSGTVNLILCDDTTLTVNGTLSVADSGTLNLYWQSGKSGKLTAQSAAGSVVSPAGEMKRTTGEGTTTFEKCLTHEWEYTTNGNEKHKQCKLCGKDGGTEYAVASVMKSGETTEAYYFDLAEAISAAAAAENSTVKLLTDVTTTDDITVNSGAFTIDLNGKTWNYEQPIYTLNVAGGKVTVISTGSTGTINGSNNAIGVQSGATLHVTSGVRMNTLCLNDGANLTLDPGVIITENLRVDDGDNIAQFLSGKALQRCDEKGTTQDEYVTLYSSYRGLENPTGCVIVIAHTDHSYNTEDECTICGAIADNATEKAEVVITNESGTTTKTYTTLLQAFSDADASDATKVEVRLLQSGTTYTLNSTKNFPICFQYVRDVEVIVDLNGCTLKRSVDAASKGILLVQKGNVTFKNGTLELDDSQNPAPAIQLEVKNKDDNPTLTLENMTVAAAKNNGYAIDAEGGTLNIKSGTYGDVIINDEFAKAQLSGGSYTSITCYKGYAALLKTGYIFADASGNYIEASAMNNNSTPVTVKACTHKNGDTSLFGQEDHKCQACGLVCEHKYNDSGVCTVCGYVCPHTNVTESGGVYTCDSCKQQMVVKVEKDGETTYYTERHNSSTDETLWWLFNNKLESGSTVTLLADHLFAWAYVSNGKTITLDLNGKTLDETSQGITVGQGSQEDTSTDNKLTVKGTLGAGETAVDGNYAFRTWSGGELNLERFEDGGKIGGIIADGGKLTTGDSTNDIKIGTLYINDGNTDISFRAGTFDKITGNDNKKLGDLLANESPIQKSGKAFKHTGEGGAFVPYNTQVTSSGIESLTITDCPHDSITEVQDSEFNTYGTCSTCGMTLIAAVLTKPDGSIQIYTTNSGSGEIFNPLTNNGGTLKLYRNLTYSGDLGTQNGTTKMVIDLNGHEVNLSSGAEAQDITLNGGTLTITDSSTDKKGKFAARLRVYYTASLVVDGVEMGTIGLKSTTASITLKAGTKFTGYERPSGTMLAQWIEDGNCISGLGPSIDVYTDKSESGSFAVKKAPAAFNITEKSGTIRYNGLMPEAVIPGITLDAGSNVSSVRMSWYYRKDGTFYMMNQNGTIYLDGSQETWRGLVNSSNVFDKFKIGETISDAFCVLTASDGSWSTILRGYSFTLANGDLSEATVVPTSLDSLVYTTNEYGSTVSQQLEFSVTHNGETLSSGTFYQIKDNSDTAYTAGEHTLVLEGLGKYAGSKLEYKWTVKPRELTGMTNLSKSYDGTTDLPDTIAFTYGKNGTVTLEKGTDYTVTGGFDNANAGERTVTATVTLKNKNYTFADGKTEQTFTFNNVSIRKAAAPTVTQTGTVTVYNHRTGIYNFDWSTLLPTLDGSKSYGTITYTPSPWNGTVDGYAVAPVLDGSKLKLTVTVPDKNYEGKIGDFTMTVSSENYEDFTLTLDLVAANRLTVSGQPMLSKTEITYGETLSSITLSGTMQCSNETVTGTFAWTNPDAAPSTSESPYRAEWTFTPDDTIYAEASGTSEIAVKPAALTGVSVQQTGELTYTGQSQAASVETKATAVNGQTVTFTYCDTQNGTYGEMPKFTEAGDHTVYFKASAPNHEDFTGSFTVTIAKADPICTAPTGMTAIYGQKLGELTLNNPSGNTPGEWTWTDGTQSVGNVGANTFTAKFTPGNQLNYNSKDGVEVTVTVGKAESTVSTAPTANSLTYNGGEQALVSAGTTADGTILYSLSETGAYRADLPTGLNADAYTVWYKVAGDENHNDSAPANVSVTIAKAQVTIAVKDKTAEVNSAAPDLSKPEQDKDYTVSGLCGSDTLTAAPTLNYAAAPDMSKPGETAISAAGADAGSNYTIAYADGKLTITARSSSGGGGGGGSSSGSTTKTETATNPDGSTTKTETKSDGTVVATTTGKDGSTTKTESKTETKPNGTTVETVTETRTEADGSKTTSKTETATAKDGSTTKTERKTETKSNGATVETVTETKTDANGVTTGTETSTTTTASGSTGTTTTVTKNGVTKTEAEATISDKAISEAKKNDEAVKVPAEVKAGGDSASAPTVKIDLPKNSGETKIEIPVEDVTSGTVAVIVKADGTEEIVKNSIPTEDGVQLTVNGGATVKIVDNAKDFADTKGHWAQESIDFVSARGLVSGTSGTGFSPDAPTTRAQLWTILARQADADLTGGSSWFEQAQNWAKANGVSDGSNPNGTVTRAQMVMMLWRAAGSPETAHVGAFADVPSGSYYEAAVAWAVQNGITAGVGSGKFAPDSTCTRAQIATFLHRSYLSQ